MTSNMNVVSANGKKRSKPQKKRVRESKKRTLASSLSFSISSEESDSESAPSEAIERGESRSAATDPPHNLGSPRAKVRQSSSSETGPDLGAGGSDLAEDGEKGLETAAPSSQDPQATAGSTSAAQLLREEESGLKDREDLDKMFEQHYLRRCTEDFADDLEQLRHEPRYQKEQSIELLVRLLKRGTDLFTAEEKRLMTAATF